METIANRLMFLLTGFRQGITWAISPLMSPNLPAKGFEEIGLGWAYIQRSFSRLIALSIRWQNGTLRPARPRTAPRKPTPARKPGLPRTRHWFIRHSGHVRHFAGWLRVEMEGHADFQRMIAEVPQARRLLRPLWRLLSPDPPPPYLALPPRPRRPYRPKLHHHRPRKTAADRRYWKPHTGTGPAMPDRHRLRIPGLNAPHLPEQQRRKNG